MSESKTLTIQLSAEESDRLEAEAKRLNLSPEALAGIILRQSLAQLKPARDPHEVLSRLRQLTENLPPSDPVEIVRAGREELENRGIF